MTRSVQIYASALLIAAAASVLVVEAKYLNPLPPSTSELFFENPNYIAQPRADGVLDYRLPNNTEPFYYDVSLWTNVHIGELPFNGTVVINLTVTEDSKTIVVHARQLSNFVASITRLDIVDSKSYSLTPEYNETLEFLSLTSKDDEVSFTKDSNWSLTITYNGTLRTDNGGFYLSTYVDDNGVTHNLATTQFESTNARHAFPCYDEPAKRAHFDITIHHDPSYTAISNMPVNDAKSSPGITAFDTTLKMSTYLLAFIVSDFEYSEGTLGGLTQRVYSRQGSQNRQRWGLVSGLLIEESLAYYFDVPFAPPKLDQAAIPDFAAGAMENWGLATYREEYLLYSRANSTVNSETNIANIIGHEYAHMWFGDLVSIKWWTYLWLKEGFATLFSYESDDIAFPEWNIYQIFHVSDYNSALMNDASVTATPMTHYVQTPNEISARYNTFSYAKPASVLYMFKNAWTDKVFRSGLHKYLSKNQLNSCDEWDLFASLQEAVDEEKYPLSDSVANIFSSWSQKGGYPLLTVVRDYSSGYFTIKQEQFTNDKDHNSTKTWYVPFNFAVASNSDFRNTSASHWIRNVPQLLVDNAKISNDDWLILNKQSTGYYRINYDDQNWQLIAEGLISNTSQIHPRNRAQLIHDAYRFMSTGRLSHSILLQLLSYLRNEDQYAPWSIANSIFSTLDIYLRGDDEYDEFRYFVIELVDEIFQKVGVHDVQGDHHLVKYLRNVLINLACLVGSENCLTLTNNKLKEFTNKVARIEPNVQTQIFCHGLRQSANDDYNYIFEALMESSVVADRSLYLSSLGCTQTESQIKKFVESSIDKSNKLTDSERTRVLNAAYSRGEVGLTASLEFLEKNWAAYGELGTETSKPLDTALKGIATYVVSEKQKVRLLALVDVVNAEGAKYVNTNLKSSVESSIETNFDWLDTNRGPLINWIAEFRKGGSAGLTASMVTVMTSLVVIVTRLL